MVNKLTKGHNLRWESSRMMLPEHVAEVNALRFESTKSKKPIIDEQQWEEFEMIFFRAKQDSRKIKITIWSNGFFKDIKGWLHNIDFYLKRIRLDIDEKEVEYINLHDIVAVELLD